MYSHVISKPIYRVLGDLTQESIVEVALPLAIKDWVRLKLKEARAQQEVYKERYTVYNVNEAQMTLEVCDESI